MRLGSGEHFGWEDPRTVRLVHVFDGSIFGEFAWLRVPEGAKGGPMEVVVRRRMSTGPWVTPSPGQRVQVEAWQLDARAVAALTAQVEAGEEPVWVPPQPSPDLCLWVEQPEGAQEVRPLLPRVSTLPETGSPEPSPALDGGQAGIVLSALGTLPRYDGISFRGRTDAALPQLRHTVVSQALVATTQDIRVATDNFTTAGLFAVIGTLGRALGEHSSRPVEKEVVFLPAAMFLVLESWLAFGVAVTLVEQLDPDRPPGTPPRLSLEEVRTLVVTHVDRARRRPDVSRFTPGKFQGGFE